MSPCHLMHCLDAECYYCYGSVKLKVALSGSPSIPPVQAPLQQGTSIVYLLLLTLRLFSIYS